MKTVFLLWRTVVTYKLKCAPGWSSYYDNLQSCPNGKNICIINLRWKKFTIISITEFWRVQNVIYNYITCVLWISAMCRGLITKTGACRAVRFINNTRSNVLSHGKCISPEVCNCLRPHPEPNYFYPDGPYCKRK